jgi:serine phosphatase RsbU (regulator of sigma subunit)
VMSTLNIISADFTTNTLVLTRNNPAPVLIGRNSVIDSLEETSTGIGIRLGSRPVITQLPIEAGLTILVFTDGLTHAGDRTGNQLEIESCFQSLLKDEKDAQGVADGLLDAALKLDHNRPVDDISVVVFQVRAHAKDIIRRVTLSLPLDS